MSTHKKIVRNPMPVKKRSGLAGHWLFGIRSAIIHQMWARTLSMNDTDLLTACCLSLGHAVTKTKKLKLAPAQSGSKRRRSGTAPEAVHKAIDDSIVEIVQQIAPPPVLHIREMPSEIQQRMSTSEAQKVLLHMVTACYELVQPFPVFRVKYNQQLFEMKQFLKRYPEEDDP